MAEKSERLDIMSTILNSCIVVCLASLLLVVLSATPLLIFRVTLAEPITVWAATVILEVAAGILLWTWSTASNRPTVWLVSLFMLALAALHFLGLPIFVLLERGIG